MADSMTHPVGARLRELADHLHGFDADLCHEAADELDTLNDLCDSYSAAIATTATLIDGLNIEVRAL